MLLFISILSGFGIYALTQVPINAVPDITNNQVQVITTSRNLATEDVEKFLTYPVELEMANLPGVKEIRSVSKFGLSVVTIVFEDDLGTYLPRQLIAEKIKAAEKEIPQDFGQPFMGPITTGLGEIYQYVLNVDPEYKNKYSLSDLRTLQDWTIRRQLSGIRGVVEVNTWGGELKQYEVALDPARLRSLNITVDQVFRALQMNNRISGGSYIEKSEQAWFIRGEGLIKNTEDIGLVLVDKRSGSPVLLRDIAEIGFGSANRFGAITGNGEGEKVMGQVMMLKDANSGQVIADVKARIRTIQENLPPGISIKPIVERSSLISRTTFTIAENLILGCLIVIFVVILLLGNWRSGLIVASVIPLSLLFTLSLMFIFNIDANLLSLGAIDFGIIIDGAVIIIEFIAFSLQKDQQHLLSLTRNTRFEKVTALVEKSTSKMMHPAVFGQLIIMIVFIPVLSLVNVEGKMFRPMALVFCFALIGAMILCFTWIPVMASLLLKPVKKEGPSRSEKFITRLSNWYTPALEWVLDRRKTVIMAAFFLLVISGFIFSRMGGEFVPTLDEGDFVIQPVIPTGTSLSKTIEYTTKMEKILLEFPEVEEVVSRIGAAEIPTDPMSMEESDIIIQLRPRKYWETAETKDALADSFKSRLSVISGIDYEFTQPIEMRFNELITGVRADVAIKIFGEDLNVLNNKAREISRIIEDVEGASDISVEKVTGLPQMSVRFDRRQMAVYGLEMDELNRIITAGFGGLSAGKVYEGEKSFDLVVRFSEGNRTSISDLRKTHIQLANGTQIPLSEVAEILETKGPAKISRDNTRRRIVVGVNVRNRDLESVVKDIQTKIDAQIELPSGYSVEYGGQFENLRTARNRLMIAVPIALLLIFVLLFLAFNSLREALLIYSAIPLAAIGGILLLTIRGMPFSISAGIGFIALFGIAVLNGIVLIEEFRSLNQTDTGNFRERIILATRNRLRPVLLTASAAALGFLPMALSTSAGAEVQRPLATVVIGGLISSTLLTLFVLPALYSFTDKRFTNMKKRPAALYFLAFIGFVLMNSNVNAQIPVTLKKAIEMAKTNNRSVQSAELRIEQQSALSGTSVNLDKTGVYYNYDQNNIAENGRAIAVWGIEQQFRLPVAYGVRRDIFDNEIQSAEARLDATTQNLELEISKAYYTVIFHRLILNELNFLDSLYQNFITISKSKFESGSVDQLELLSVQAKQKEKHLQKIQEEAALKQSLILLNNLIQSDSTIDVVENSLPTLVLNNFDTSENPGLKLLQLQINKAALQTKNEKTNLLPDIQLQAFQGTNQAPNNKIYNGITVGLQIPLLHTGTGSRISAAKTNELIAEQEKEDFQIQLVYRYQQLTSQADSYLANLEQYNDSGKELARQIEKHATSNYSNGSIDYATFAMHVDQARQITITYYQNLLAFNFTVLEANFLLHP